MWFCGMFTFLQRLNGWPCHQLNPQTNFSYGKMNCELMIGPDHDDTFHFVIFVFRHQNNESSYCMYDWMLTIGAVFYANSTSYLKLPVYIQAYLLMLLIHYPTFQALAKATWIWIEKEKLVCLPVLAMCLSGTNFLVYSAIVISCMHKRHFS